MAALPYVRLEVGGTISGTQTWSVGFSFGLVSMPTNGQVFTWLSGIVTNVATWINATGGVKTLWGTNVTYNRLRAYAYNASAMTAGAQSQVIVTPITGAGGITLPPQCAVVHSLLTGSPGAGNRGRIYVPITTGGSTTNAQLTNTTCSNLATALATFLAAVASSHVGADLATPVIATRGSKPYHTLGSVGVDSKLDTQRRRTDKIAATTPLTAVAI